MQYLKIENPGVAPSECFTLLGCSTSRDSGNSDVSGQFGSGLKHAVNLLLARGYNPVIYCGNLSLEYFFKPIEINDDITVRRFHQVGVKLSGKNEQGRSINRCEDLSWTLEHGSLDWGNISMACREFLSNAVDRCVKMSAIDKLVIEVVEENQVRAKKGHTRIFIPYCNDVIKFHLEIHKRFLNIQKITPLGVMDKKCRNLSTNGAMVYRKGILVKETGSQSDSIFDYNLGDELYIDECRNSNEYDVLSCATKYILCNSTHEQKVKFLCQLLSDKKEICWEESISQYGARSVWEYYKNDDLAAQWKAAWDETGEKSTVLLENRVPLAVLSQKGLRPAYSKSFGWYYLLTQLGLPTGDNTLSENDKIGRSYAPARESLLEVANTTWEWMCGQGLVNNKPFPKVVEFTQDGLKEYGFYQEGTIYINSVVVGDSVLCKAVVFEELVHYVTGLEDYTLELQQYLFHLLARFIH